MTSREHEREGRGRTSGRRPIPQRSATKDIGEPIRQGGSTARRMSEDDERSRATARQPDGWRVSRLLSRRTALLALVICALGLSLAVPLHTYLSQRADLQAQQQQQQALQAQFGQLQREQQQLSDPAQVAAKARSLLGYVMPGETPYVVQLPTNVPPEDAMDNQRRASYGIWYDQLWRSIVENPH